MLPLLLFIGCAAENASSLKTSTANSSAANSAVKLDVDWPAFLQQHDLKSDRLPTNWTDAPMFGNATLGSMIWQEGNALKFQLHHADVNDHRDQSAGWTAYARPRFQIGALHLKPVGKIIGGDWRLDLWNAELTGHVKTDQGNIRFRHFVHADQMVMATELWTSPGETNCQWTWHPGKAEPTRDGVPRTTADFELFAKRYGDHYRQTLKPYELNPPGQPKTIGEVEVWQQDMLAGGQYATAWAEVRTGRAGSPLPAANNDTLSMRQETSPDGAHGVTRPTFSHRVLYTSIAQNFPQATATDAAVRAVESARRTSLDQFTRTHRAWWHDYYPRSFVSLPEAPLEALYWQTIYRFGCTARQGRAFVNTAGLWFQGGSWPYITTDWNIQASHWGLPDANRLEQSGEILESLHRHRATLVANVLPEEWRADSAFLALAVAPDLIGERDEDMRYWDCVGNLPWTLHNAWWQYRYTMDDAMLREKLFPLLRRSVNLYLHLLKEDNGTLHLPPTFSPESGIFKDCNFDLALLKWGCATLLWSGERLKIADPLIPKWRDVLARTIDFPADEKGFMAGSNASRPGGHRHASHLLMIYPLMLANIEQPERRAVLNKSVEEFWATKGLPAMVMTHAVPMASVIGRSDLAVQGLRRQAKDLFPNGLWFKPPCIESSLSIANGVQTMLLQSWGDTIRVFPAAPAEWRDLVFHDLRTEGAFLVSAARREGKTSFIRIRSLAGEPCRVKTDLLNLVRFTGASAAIKPLGGGVFEIALKRGEEIILVSEGETVPPRIAPVTPRPTSNNENKSY